MALGLAVAERAGAQAAITGGPAVQVSIDAALREGGREITGTAVFRIANDTGGPIGAVPLWLYPNRFARMAPRIDDRLVRFLYPSGESPGRMAIADPRWNGKPLPADAVAIDSAPLPGFEKPVPEMIARVRLPAALPAGGTGSLSVAFRVKIPERRGRFGRWRGTVSLAGGWFPRPLPDLSGNDMARPPDAMAIDARVALPGRRGAVMHDRVFPWSEKPQVAEALGMTAEDLCLVVLDRMEVDEQRFDWGYAVHVHREHRYRSPAWKETREREGGLPTGVPGAGRLDYAGRLFEVVGNTAALMRSATPGAALPDRIVLVDVPAWDRLAQPGPGPVLVSDRLWRIVPVEKALWFHDLALAREVGAALVWPAVLAAEGASERRVVADLIGSSLAERYRREVHQGSATVGQMVGFVSFLPVIDNLIYAPQVPFREAYDPSVEEPDPLRDEPWRFMNRLPRGRRILGKLEDLVGAEKARAVADRVVGERIAFRTAAAAELRDRAEPFFADWYGDYPSVNYRLGRVTDQPLPGGRWRHRVEIFRDGAPVREPVAVRITDRNKEAKTLVWDGAGPGTVLEWVSEARQRKVEIDPAKRLVEDPKLVDDHPSADNLRPLPWRPPIFSGIYLSGDLLAGDVYVSGGLLFRRRYDLSNLVSAYAIYTPRHAGGVVGYYRYFGPKRTLNARSWFLGPTLGAYRFFAVGDQVGQEIPEKSRFGATAGSLGFDLGRDDRWFYPDPRSGSRFLISADYTLGGDDRRRAVQMGKLSAEAGGVFSPAVRHTLALWGGAMGLVGEPAAAQLATLSVREILRSFDVEETYGRAGLYLVLEWRHTLFAAPEITLPFFQWFDRLQGVLFLGAGTITRPGGYTGLFSEDRLFSEAGYGLRFHFLSFGAQPFTFALDFAVPITPLHRRTLEYERDGSVVSTVREPYKILFGVWQTF